MRRDAVLTAGPMMTNGLYSAPPGTKGPILLVAAAALVRNDGRILLARRPAGRPMAGLWEFPGGKVKSSETPEAGLCRELSEELGIGVLVEDLKPIAFASHPYPEFHLLMPLFLCREWVNSPSPLEGQEIRWVRVSNLRKYPMPPADGPLVRHLCMNLD